MWVTTWTGYPVCVDGISSVVFPPRSKKSHFAPSEEWYLQLVSSVSPVSPHEFQQEELFSCVFGAGSWSLCFLLATKACVCTCTHVYVHTCTHTSFCSMKSSAELCKRSHSACWYFQGCSRLSVGCSPCLRYSACGEDKANFASRLTTTAVNPS